jgi:nucleotide-binding universal stress UspA family protein
VNELPTKIILAGVDESKHSADALALAGALAPFMGAEVVAAYVHPSADFEPELGVSVGTAQLMRVADRSAARGLQRVAEEGGALLITLGASERSPLGRVILGSTAERLMSGSPCPVAVAPSGYADGARSIGAIGCAFDASPESRAALAWATSMADRSGVRVRIVAVHEPLASETPGFQEVGRLAQDEADRDDLSRQVKAAALDLRRADVGVDANLFTGRAVDVLEEQSSELDLLVMGSRGYGPQRAVLLGSVSGALIRRAACPVVVVPRGADPEVTRR